MNMNKKHIRYNASIPGAADPTILIGSTDPRLVDSLVNHSRIGNERSGLGWVNSVLILVCGIILRLIVCVSAGWVNGSSVLVVVGVVVVEEAVVQLRLIMEGVNNRSPWYSVPLIQVITILLSRLRQYLFGLY